MSSILKSHFVIQDGDALTVGKRKTNKEEDSNIPIPIPVEEKRPDVKLSVVGKIAEGDGYTYLKASVTDCGLRNICCLLSYQHLQFIDVSNNQLTLKALQVLTRLQYIVFIQANHNLLESAALKRMPYLQVLVLNNNQIESLYDIVQPELCTLELGFNKITSIDLKYTIPTLRCLDLRNNRIKDIKKINFENLDSLYLAYNLIKELDGIEKLPNLRILHLRGNPIKRLDGFDTSNGKLQYLNVRETKLRSLNEIKKLRVLKALETIVLKSTPYVGDTEDDEKVEEERGSTSSIRVEVLATIPWLKKINKLIISDEEREEAATLRKQWIEEGEPFDENQTVEEGEEGEMGEMDLDEESSESDIDD